MAYPLRLCTGLSFRFPDLGFVMKGHQIFLGESPETVDVLLYLLNINWLFILRFLDDWVPSISHLLKFALSNRDLPFVCDRPFPYSL